MIIPAAAAITTITTGETPKKATATNVTSRITLVGTSTTPFFAIFHTDCSTSAQTAMRIPANACCTTARCANCWINAAMIDGVIVHQLVLSRPVAFFNDLALQNRQHGIAAAERAYANPCKREV